MKLDFLALPEGERRLYIEQIAKRCERCTFPNRFLLTRY